MSRVAGTTFAQAEGPPVERELQDHPDRLRATCSLPQEVSLQRTTGSCTGLERR